MLSKKMKITQKKKNSFKCCQEYTKNISVDVEAREKVQFFRKASFKGLRFGCIDKLADQS